MFPTLRLIFLLTLLGASMARYNNLVPKFYAKDSAIIVDTDQPPAPKFSKANVSAQAVMLPYYQPIQTIPAYRIISKTKTQNSSQQHAMPKTAIFTQEEFPRDLLEIAQQKLGLKTLDEVPSVTELAELLGTNSAAETISYIKQLTSTDQGIALIKAYIESSDYTDSVGNKDNEIESPTTTLPPKPQIDEMATTTHSENVTNTNFFARIAAFLNFENAEPQQEQIMAQAARKRTELHSKPYQKIQKNMPRPLYVRSPLPYHYPIPLRPVLVNRTNYNAIRMYNRHAMPVPFKVPPKPAAKPPHLNTVKSFTPAHIQQLARIANIPPKTLESFLQRKPKLAELAAKVASFPLTQESSPLADGQLLAAVHKAIENDEDLKKLFNSAETLK